MIWQNPWAWAGLLTLGVPLFIHLLSRHRARVQRFPTLRFLELSRLTPTRRTRLSDLLLLAIRLGILIAAVAALAQPLWLTANRSQALGSALGRAIVVDTSASMRRATVGGERAVDVARRDGRRLAGEAAASVVLETAVPAHAFAGAVAWLRTQTGTRELILLSDFQLGALDSAMLAEVPPGLGVRLSRVDTPRVDGPLESMTRQGDAVTIARVTLSPTSTDVEWTIRASTSDSAAVTPTLLVGASERDGAAAAKRAALSVGVASAVAATHASDVVIVYPHYEQRAELVRGARAIDSAWVGDVIARLRADSMLAAAASNADVEPGLSEGLTPFAVVARTDGGEPAVLAARGTQDGRERLLLFSLADAGSLTSATLISAATRATIGDVPASELEPATLPDETLRRWERPATATVSVAPSRDGSGPSDGRWLWIVALVLLGVEELVRRRADAPNAAIGAAP